MAAAAEHAHQEHASDQFAEQVKAFYQRVDNQLQALLIAALMSRELRRPGFVEEQVAAARQIAAQARAMVQPYAERHIRDGYLRGMLDAQRDWLAHTTGSASQAAALTAPVLLGPDSGAGKLGEQLISMETFARDGLKGPTARDVEALNALLASANDKIASTEALVEQTFTSALRAVVDQQLLAGVQAGEDREQLTRRLTRSITDAGLTHTGTHRKLGEVRMVRPGARNLQLADYVETIVSSVPRRASTVATVNFADELGHDLFQVSSHVGSCDLCATHQGEIITRAELATAEIPPFHPHCWHFLLLYFGPRP